MVSFEFSVSAEEFDKAVNKAYKKNVGRINVQGFRKGKAPRAIIERYSGKEYGLVHSWVIANEINQQKIWNYMDTEDVTYYAEEFEKAFYIEA